LISDGAGNLYGVTQNGGANGWGSIFEQSPSESGWTETILYSFHGASDGGAPYSGVIFDGEGNLYGTATASSGANFGTVFELSPSQSGWSYSELYTFTGGNDGGQPVAGLIFDNAGNLTAAIPAVGWSSMRTAISTAPPFSAAATALAWCTRSRHSDRRGCLFCLISHKRLTMFARATVSFIPFTAVMAALGPCGSRPLV